MNVLGVIMARGGSVRLPKKNILPLGGKPLICWTINAALKAKLLNRVIVSTDNDEIMRVAGECGAEVPFRRPAELSVDCPSEWVTKHALEFIEKESGETVDIVVTIQPTTPFIISDDIDSCVKKLLDNNTLNSVFTVSQVRERPEWMFIEEKDDRVSSYVPGEIKGERGVSQSLVPLVVPNGGAYATRRSALMEEGVIISKNSGVHIMPYERSVDIDEEIDFKYATFLTTLKGEDK
jgi:CMP-N-acetylneuraminic acid synthetase